MVAFLVAELDPVADVRRAANALRTPAIEVFWFQVDQTEFIAAVGCEDFSALADASDRMRSCPGVRSTYLSLSEPHA
jgi:hypothetical protein